MNVNKQLLKQKPKLLLYVGYQRQKSGWFRSLHSHSFCEIMFIKSGSGKVRIDDEEYAFEQGDLVVYNPGTMHVEYCNEAPPCELFFLGISKLHLEGLEKGCLCKDKFAIYKSGNYYKQVLFYLDQLIIEKELGAVQSGKISDSLLNIIISYVVRLSEATEEKIFEAKETYLQIKNYIDDNYASGATIDDICRHLYINKYYFTHLFKDAAGVSPLKYIISKRIDLAKTMLEQSDEKVDVIAQKCGYVDVAYFSRAFKKVEGISPLEYRKRNKKN